MDMARREEISDWDPRHLMMEVMDTFALEGWLSDGGEGE